MLITQALETEAMRTLLMRAIFLILSVFFSVALVAGQTGSNEKRIDRSFDVTLEKSNYVLLEPITATFSFSLRPGESFPRLLETTSITIKGRDGVRRFSKLTNVVNSSPTESLPPSRSSSLKQIVEMDKTREPAEKMGVHSAAEIITCTDIFFPIPGKYTVQFSFRGAKSKEIEINIETPVGINDEAFAVLKKYDDPLSFRWVFENGDGSDVLRKFVADFPNSVYHDYSAYELGLLLFYRNDLEGSRTVLTSLQTSPNPVLSKKATALLKNIESEIINAQEGAQPMFEARLEKNNYVAFEPMFVEFTLKRTNTPTISRPSQDTVITITKGEKTREFTRLTKAILTGGIQQLPGQASPDKYEVSVLIDRVAEFFPEPGLYTVQFVLDGLTSEPLNITISPLENRDKEAFNFIRQQNCDVVFNCIWAKKDKVAALEEFVDTFGDTVFGDFAIKTLADFYLANGEIFRAKIQFEKISASNRPVIAKKAKRSLSEIKTQLSQ